MSATRTGPVIPTLVDFVAAFDSDKLDIPTIVACGATLTVVQPAAFRSRFVTELGRSETFNPDSSDNCFSAVRLLLRFERCPSAEARDIRVAARFGTLGSLSSVDVVLHSRSSDRSAHQPNS